MALGIHAVGHQAFLHPLFQSMGIKVTAGFDCHPMMQSRQRERKRLNAKKTAVKRHCCLRQCKQLTEATTRFS